MFVKFRESGQFGEEVWINPNNVFAVRDHCSVGTLTDGRQSRINTSLIYSGGGNLDENHYIRVEGSVHETLAKLNEGN